MFPSLLVCVCPIGGLSIVFWRHAFWVGAVTQYTQVNMGKSDPARPLKQKLVNIAKVRAFLTAFWLVELKLLLHGVALKLEKKEFKSILQILKQCLDEKPTFRHHHWIKHQKLRQQSKLGKWPWSKLCSGSSSYSVIYNVSHSFLSLFNVKRLVSGKKVRFQPIVDSQIEMHQITRQTSRRITGG